jgi:hypothetical protein
MATRQRLPDVGPVGKRKLLPHVMGDLSQTLGSAMEGCTKPKRYQRCRFSSAPRTTELILRRRSNTKGDMGFVLV